MDKKTEALSNTIIGMVPQWYSAESGAYRYELYFGDEIVSFYSKRALTPQLTVLLTWINAKNQTWLEDLPAHPTPRALGSVMEEIVLEWLRSNSSQVYWKALLAHLDQASRVSNENSSVARNLIISSTDGGSEKISEPSIQKVLSSLACGTHTYLKVDQKLRFVDYQEVGELESKPVPEYKLHPDFLHPVWSKLEYSDYSAHLTGRGDQVILSPQGLLASCRRGKWHIYDVFTFKNFMGDAMGNYRVGCNFFDLVFDLSCRRHGALLVYDPDHKVLKEVTNKGAVIKEGTNTSDRARALLRPALSNIAMGGKALRERKKRLFFEIASVDGAVIFDRDQILAFGAIINSHPEAGDHYGARTTAAFSAFKWGGKPVKVSADGDITFIFKSGSGRETCDARIEFL